MIWGLGGEGRQIRSSKSWDYLREFEASLSYLRFHLKVFFKSSLIKADLGLTTVSE